MFFVLIFFFLPVLLFLFRRARLRCVLKEIKKIKWFFCFLFFFLFLRVNRVITAVTAAAERDKSLRMKACGRASNSTLFPADPALVHTVYMNALRPATTKLLPFGWQLCLNYHSPGASYVTIYAAVPSPGIQLPIISITIVISPRVGNAKIYEFNSLLNKFETRIKKKNNHKKYAQFVSRV